MPAPAAIIFDLDGTLMDSMPFHKKSWLEFLQKNGLNLSDEDFESQNHGTIQEMIARLFGDDLEPAHFQSLCYEKEALYRSMYRPHLKEIDGAIDFLKILKSLQIKTALATMGNQLNIDFSLDGLGIRDCFDVVCGGDDVKKGKPHPEIFHLAAARLQLTPENCIVVEDSAGGIAAGLNAGMKVVGITTMHNRHDLLHMGCSKVIDNYVNVEWEQWFV